MPTWSGFLYLSIVLDVFSRKVVGWAMGATLHTELMALTTHDGNGLYLNEPFGSDQSLDDHKRTNRR